MFTTRFAPSPTGPLHLGHAYSAMLAHEMARTAGGQFLLRIEDIDTARSRPEWVAQIFDDLRWLGLSWPEPVMLQSTRGPAYRAAIDQLAAAGLLYECACSRADIAAAASAPQEGVATHGPDGLIYPGTCRGTWNSTRNPDPDRALRLDMRLAVPKTVTFRETGQGPRGEMGLIRVTPEDALSRIGDVVLARRGWGTSYHLSVVLDDAAQGITHVVRGEDLFEATKIHAILQTALGLPTPLYHHHRLIRDEAGKRLAKRDDARAISLYRAEGATPADIRRLVGL